MNDISKYDQAGAGRSQEARQNETRPSEQRRRLQALMSAGQEIQDVVTENLGGVVIDHSAFKRNSLTLSLEKQEMFDILAPCLEMKAHLPANL